MNKVSVHQEDMILNVYDPKKRGSKYMTRKLIKLQEEIDKPCIIFGYCNTLLSELGK